MQDESDKKRREVKNKSFRKQDDEPTLELLQAQIHYDWAGIQQPLCDRPYQYTKLWTQNEVEVSCPDCWYILATKHIRADGSVSYYRATSKTWDYDYLMDEPF